MNPIEITKNMYRDALHVYLKHAYPGMDDMYYSKWAFLHPPERFWKDAGYKDGHDVPGIPREIRFGCHISGNCKLRCYPEGFIFDTNHRGDPEHIIKEVKRIKEMVENEWKKVGIPIHGGH